MGIPTDALRGIDVECRCSIEILNARIPNHQVVGLIRQQPGLLNWLPCVKTLVPLSLVIFQAVLCNEPHQRSYRSRLNVVIFAMW